MKSQYAATVSVISGRSDSWEATAIKIIQIEFCLKNQKSAENNEQLYRDFQELSLPMKFAINTALNQHCRRSLKKFIGLGQSIEYKYIEYKLNGEYRMIASI